MRQDVIDLYDEYTHAPLSRRTFIARLAQLLGGTAAAYAVLPLLEANYAGAAVVAPDDPGLTVGRVAFPGADGELRGYLARPADAPPLPGIVVIHENRGLNPHIEDVTRRAALAGYVALAPDFLSSAGGTPDDPDRARELIGGLDPQATLGDAVQAVAFLRSSPLTTGKVGAVGFCWGGALVNRLAVQAPDLDAAVVFYGRVPETADVARIEAPLLLHFAGLDERINAGMAGYEAALKAAGKDYTLHLYDGVNHAFHNDTSEARYDAAAAKLAWQRTMAFFDRHLKG
ncbi:MAG: dienelactone hydrolase family protein [Pseudomonadota bacterium]|nr:dienelactone hydrolase family protein [Pseudomonadota bacterium]